MKYLLFCFSAASVHSDCGLHTGIRVHVFKDMACPRDHKNNVHNAPGKYGSYVIIQPDPINPTCPDLQMIAA